METTTFRQKMQIAREEAILEAVNTLLATKGFDLMTVDAVAAEAGIAKASLYRHFPSKEDLAAAAMMRMLDAALAQAAAQPEERAPLDKLKTMSRWAMATALAGNMPSLPHANSSLVTALSKHEGYLERVFRLSDEMGGWILAAQEAGVLNPGLSPQLILFRLFANACDPVLHFMKATGQYSDEDIIAMMLTTCFDGLTPPCAA
ncbi:TetR/AcrR family transcriptional regulator [Chitinimonas sp. BJYL2]|uniref:TetR/AcrR family transcriptional regulator n=1 Tax=Chitinimonas sp. BJYL2 TaxID=2976696 RepID=UPI0022B37DD9|nr:TetR/AcrR family transcriptional regulator [Chitinimonas sp. BJYL2]